MKPALRAHLNGEESAWHLQNRCVVEIAGEEFDVDGGRHEDQPQVWAQGQKGTQHSQQEVTVQVSLMHLVHDQHLVLSQGIVPLDLPEQETLGQEQQFGSCGAVGLKADLVPNLKTERTRQYVFGNPFSNSFLCQDSLTQSVCILYEFSCQIL